MQKTKLQQKRKSNNRCRKRHGRPIKGSSEAFKRNTDFFETSILLQRGLFEKDDLLCFRNSFKDMVVNRFYIVGVAKHQYQEIPVPLIREFTKMLERKGVEQKTIHNLRCMLSYWNQGDNHQGKKVKCRVPESSNAHECKMAWKRAGLDCQVACKELVKPVFKYVEKKASVEGGISYITMISDAGDYASVESTVRIFTELFEFLYIKALPSKLSLRCIDIMPDGGAALDGVYSREGENLIIKSSKMKKAAHVIGMAAAVRLYIYLNN